MTLAQVLKEARGILSTGGIEDAALISELLLMHILSIDRVRLYLNLNNNLAEVEKTAYSSLIERALTGEPTAYIVGHREFYGLDFSVNNHVLIPRPETELLVDIALRLAPGYTDPVIADIGTGSGAIAISLAVKLPRATIYATDISSSALEVASLNCHRHGVTDRISLLQGDLLAPLPGPVDIIIANLPYVRKPEASSASLEFEPPLALDGGQDGLEPVRRLCAQAPGKLKRGGSLLLEVGQGQAPSVIALLSRAFPLTKIEVTADLNGIERVVSLCLLSQDRA